MTAKTHFAPYMDELDEAPENAACGVWLSENLSLSGNWNHVDCKRCLAARAKIERICRETERTIVNQMGAMADYWRQEKLEAGKENA